MKRNREGGKVKEEEEGKGRNDGSKNSIDNFSRS